MMIETNLYAIEFAVESSTEIRAMGRLKELGISRADEAKLSDLDRQAGLFIIKAYASENEMTDEVYDKLSKAKDVFILFDELSAKRAQEIIKLTAIVEQQLKKLLICVLPETEKVFDEIINKHQQHKSKLTSVDRIDRCGKINDFSFGELPLVLQQDVSELAKKQLLSSQGLISLISSSKDFDELKLLVVEISKPKTVWNSISTILEEPIEYNYVSKSIDKLVKSRNDAAHLKTIKKKYLADTKKSKEHVMKYISKIKSNYRNSLQIDMKSLAESMKHILESTVKIDPAIFTEYQKMMSETFKPFTDTMLKLKLDIISPDTIDAINKNSDYYAQIMKSFNSVFGNMQVLDGFHETMKELTDFGFSKAISASIVEAGELKFDISKIIESKNSEAEK